ncbi:MAG TPA: hypothetical protein VE890_06295 [Thermoguttaceae bacterium]|nr:hypothetical protein [Thermoguttaceae bacterium]
MANDRQSAFTLADIYNASSRHKRKAIALFLATVAVTVVATVLMPEAYRSEGSLFVRFGRENATLDPTATLGQEAIVAEAPSHENEMNTIVEIISSRVLAETVVDTLGTPAVLGQEPVTESHSVSEAAEALSDAELDARDRAVSTVAKGLSVKPVRNANVVQIAYDSPNPELSKAVVAQVIDTCLDRHAVLNRTPGAHEFLVKETESLRAKLSHAEETLRDLRNETGLVSPEEQRNMLVRRCSRLEDELLATLAKLASAEAGVNAVEESLEGRSETKVIGQTAGIANEGTDAMRQQLYALQLEEQRLRAKYTDESFKVKEIREQIAVAKAILDKEEPVRTHVTLGPDRAFEAGQLALVDQKPQLSSLRASVDQLRTQLVEARRELKTLNNESLRIAELQREVDLLDAQYRKYTVNLDQSRIDQALEDQKLSSISIMQPATFNRKPIRPRKAMNLLLGMLAGAIGAIFLIFALEYWHRSVERPKVTEGELELSKLVSIARFGNGQSVGNGQH